jgi:hypothetical protein
MRLRTVTVLAVIGAVVLGGGWYVGQHAVPSLQPVDRGVLMFPDLAPRLQKAQRIEIVHQGATLVIEKAADSWGLANRGGYKVQASKLRFLLTRLTDLRLIEPATDDPANLLSLGVEDPGKDADSTLLRVLDDSGQPIAALIVGQHRARTEATLPDQFYVRRPDDAQSWLAEGTLQPDTDPLLWLDRDVMNIDHGRIAAVTVARGDTVLAFGRHDGRLLLTAPGDHPPLDEYRLQEVSRALELLTFQDVQTDAQSVGASIGRSVFATSDGLAVSAILFAATDPGAGPGDPSSDKTSPRGDSPATPAYGAIAPGIAPTGRTTVGIAAPGVSELTAKTIWVRFEAAGEGAAKPEAEQLSARLTGWTFRLGAWQERSLEPTLDDLRTPPPGPSARQAPPE